VTRQGGDGEAGERGKVGFVHSAYEEEFCKRIAEGLRKKK